MSDALSLHRFPLLKSICRFSCKENYSTLWGKKKPKVVTTSRQLIKVTWSLLRFLRYSESDALTSLEGDCTFPPQHSLLSTLSSLKYEVLWTLFTAIYNQMWAGVGLFRSVQVRTTHKKHTQTEKKSNRKTGGDERNSWFQGRWTADWWRSSAEKKKTASEWMRPVWMRGCGAV